MYAHLHTHTHTTLHSVHPQSSKVICMCKEHWEVVLIDRQIVAAEIPIWQRKAPNAWVKSQPQKSPQNTSHESKLEHFVRLSEPSEVKRAENIRAAPPLPKWRNVMLFVQTRDVNHKRSSLRARPHANVSSVVHYNSTPDLEEWHSSEAALGSTVQLCHRGEKGIIKTACLFVQETL